jgi:uncharacterized protein YjbI with pentapeptide repeats
MRVLKPDTLTYLCKVLSTEQGMVLCSTVLGGFVFDTAAADRLLPEAELWALVAASLPRGEVLDWSLPKPEAEFLVYGACHLAAPVKAAQVRVAVAEKTKTLDVYGRRTWQGDHPGDPEPFTAAPVDWAHAYGGPDFPENPLGLGRTTDAHGARALPNILPEGYHPRSPDDPCPPVGLAAFGGAWPQRTRHFGPFDQAWLTDRWPYYPHGTSLEYCLTAPSDQRLDRFFTGDEPVVIHNMHPTESRLENRLPGLRVRLFLNRTVKGAATFQERPCRADTLWLFPEHRAGILAWRNLTVVADEDLADIRQVLLDVEALGAQPQPVEHYQALLAEHLAPPPEADESPTPPQAPSPPPETSATPPPQGPNEADAVMASAVADLETEVDTLLAKLGISREQADEALRKLTAEPKPQSMDGLLDAYEAHGGADTDAAMAQIQQMSIALDKQVDTLLAKAGLTREQAEQQLAERGQVPPADPVAALDALLARPDLPDEARAKFQESRQAFVELQRVMAELDKPEPAPEPEAAARTLHPEPESKSETRNESGPDATTVDQILASQAKGESLAGHDLRHLDFSGRDLTGMDFSGCRLDGAKFTNAELEGANFTGARLDEARFEAAQARHAIFTDCLAPKAVFAAANLTGAGMDRADLTEADFSQALLTKVVLDGATLAQATLTGVSARNLSAKRTDFTGARLVDADLRQSVLDEADLSGADCAGLDCRQASAPGLRLTGANCPGARFKAARLQGARADADTDLTKADLRQADLTLVAFEGARLPGVEAKRAVLVRADLTGADLTGARLPKADARGARFDKAVLVRADLTKLGGLGASFRKTRLTDCVLRKANLFRANLYKCVLERTDLTGANCDQTVLDHKVLSHAR